MAIPDFLGIGMQRAGTSWLAANLRKHPEIWIPPLKEIHYFDELEANPGTELPDLLDRKLPYSNHRVMKIMELAKNPATMADGEIAKWYLKWLFQKRTDEWYFSLFDFPHTAKIAGEITPDYGLLPERAVAAIKRMNPELKVILSLRNPLYRCWSQVAFHFDKFRPVPLAEAAEEDIINFIKSENVLRNNNYVAIAGKWRKFFSGDNFYVYFFDEIARAPYALMLDICKFLGVAAFPSELSGQSGAQVNRGSYADFPPKYKALIAGLTIDHIRDCAETFGGDCAGWQEEAEAILS